MSGRDIAFVALCRGQHASCPAAALHPTPSFNSTLILMQSLPDCIPIPASCHCIYSIHCSCVMRCSATASCLCTTKSILLWAFQVSLLQQGISALAQHSRRSPSLPPFLLMLSLSLSLSPLLSMCRQGSVLYVCVCMRRVDGDAVCWSWELQGDCGNGEGYSTLTTVTMQCPLPEHLHFTSLHLSVFLLPLSFSRLRWSACLACSVCFSAATTSPGKSYTA